MALITAATNCNLDIMVVLLEESSDFDLVELTEVLILVCAWGSIEALQLLLRHDENKVLGVQQYFRGLKKAVQKGKSKIVLYWLEEHPQRQHLVVEPGTVINAAGNGFMDILLLLVKKIRPMDDFAQTLNQCLQVASRNGHQKVLEYLIEEGADLKSAVEKVQDIIRDDDPFYQTFFPPIRGTSKRLKRLTSLQAALIGFKRFKTQTEHRYTYGPGGLESSLTGADASSQQRIIEILLGKGADPNEAAEYQRYPLYLAAKYGTVETVQALISSGAHPEAATEKPGTALEVAASRELGSLPIIKTLLKANTLTLSADLSKIAALDIALSYFEGSAWSRGEVIGSFQESDSIAEVLDHGAGAAVKTLLAHLPEQKADDSRYALLAQMACVVGDQECIELLSRRGLDVNITGHYYGNALQAACRVGNVAIVECLLSFGANVNVLQGAHGTALRAATFGGHEELVRRLISLGADVNLCYKDKDKSILHLALEARNSVTFKALLSAGADINVETPKQQPILVAACKYGETTLIELLLASGADVNTSKINTTYYPIMPEVATPLHAACAEGHISMVRLLLDHKADIEKTIETATTPLIFAIRENHLSVVHLLLDAGADVNHAVDTSPIAEAAKDCKLEILELLLNAGAIIGGPSTKVNALARACHGSEHMAVELLLDALYGTQYEAEICSEALAAAVKKGDDKIVCLLLECGVAPTFDMLRQACSEGCLEVLKVLVNMGFDVNGDDGEDHPLLHVAACHSRPDVVEFLIDQGANINLRSTKYGSPLIAAMEGIMAPLLRSQWDPSCQWLAKQLPLPGSWYDGWTLGGKQSSQKPGYKEVLRCEQIVHSLLNAGAEIDTSIRGFGNALHLASYMGSVIIVRQLLERMENVNVFGGYFGSPLLAALREGHEKIVELLLDRNIDVNAPSPEHGSAFHFVCANGSKEMVQNLLDHRGDINAQGGKWGSALAAAAEGTSNRRGAEKSSEEYRAIVDLLLHHGPKVQIKECDLIAAASDQCYIQDENNLMQIFLKYDPSVMATEQVIVETVKKITCYDVVGDNLPLLLKRDGGLGTTPAMLEAAKNVAVMKLLLEHKPTCQVTSKVLESAAQRYGNAPDLVDLLLSHDPKASITEAAVKAAIGFKSISRSEQSALKLLLDRDPEFKITDILLEAADNARTMEVLLNRRTEDQAITSELLETAAKHYSNGAALVSLLLKYDKSVKITPAVVSSAITCTNDAESFFRTLFERDPTLEITPEDLIALVKSVNDWQEREERNIVNILLEFQKTVEFTAELREALDEKFQSQSDLEMKDLFCRLERRRQ